MRQPRESLLEIGDEVAGILQPGVEADQLLPGSRSGTAVRGGPLRTGQTRLS